MNACLRAIVKSAGENVEIIGIRYGGLGLVRNLSTPPDYVPLSRDDVSGIMHRSGTILKTVRDQALSQYLIESGHELADVLAIHAETLGEPGDSAALALADLAAEALVANNVEALALLGGDTTCRSAWVLKRKLGPTFPIAVIPASIDHDVKGTAHTIGFDSALQLAMSHIDAIRETAISMQRIFVVEVMGRRRGFLAAAVALATGAEAVLVPERAYDTAAIDHLASQLAAAQARGSSCLVIIAEGTQIPTIGGSGAGRPLSSGEALAESLSLRIPHVEVKVAVLGHVQRGAPPTAFTRLLASRAGVACVKALVDSTPQEEPLLIAFTSSGHIDVMSAPPPAEARDNEALDEALRLQDALAF